MGRPTDVLKHRFQAILEESGADRKFREILRNTKKEDVFLKAYDVAYDRAWGKPLQSVDMDLNDVTNRPTAEQLNVALGSLNGHSEGTGLDKAV